MDYIKSRWSTNGNSEAPVSQPQATETSYSAVTFSNAQQNPIFIATQHPSQISIIHEVRNNSLKASDMTSPADSFHSVVSTFHNDKRDRSGKVNLGFSGSNSDMNNQPHHQQTTQSQHPQNRVFHQSYWSWHWPWETWNTREKIFLLVIVILSLCILSLTSVLSIVLQKNIEYRKLVLDRFPGINI